MSPIIYFCYKIHDTLLWISAVCFWFPRIFYEGIVRWVSPEHVRASWRDTCTCLLPVKWGTAVYMGSKDTAVEVGEYKVIYCVMMSCVAWYCSIQAFVAHCHYGKQALFISNFVGVSVFLVYVFFCHPCVPPPPQLPLRALVGFNHFFCV
jgi:hypothetical protein